MALKSTRVSLEALRTLTNYKLSSKSGLYAEELAVIQHLASVNQVSSNSRLAELLRVNYFRKFAIKFNLFLRCLIPA